MVFRMELTYIEIEKIIDMKYIDASSSGYAFLPGTYKNSHLKSMLKSLFPDEVKVDFTIDDIRLKSILTTTEKIRFIESFFHTILGFTQSYLGTLGDIESFIQLISGSYKSDKPIYITGNDKIPLKIFCTDGSFVNGVQESILYSFGLHKPPGHKIHKDPRLKLLIKINKAVLPHITFYFEDDDYKPVDFNGETIHLLVN